MFDPAAGSAEMVDRSDNPAKRYFANYLMPFLRVKGDSSYRTWVTQSGLLRSAQNALEGV